MCRPEPVDFPPKSLLPKNHNPLPLICPGFFAAGSVQNSKRVRHTYNTERNGHYEYEMQKIFDSMGLNHLTEAQVGAIHKACDPDGSGALEYDEFIDMVYDHDGEARRTERLPDNPEH